MHAERRLVSGDQHDARRSGSKANRMRSSDLPGEPGRNSSMFLGLDAGAARPHRRVEAPDRDQPINVRDGLARSAGNIAATHLPDAKRRTTSARPSATSAIETLRSIVAPAGVSGLGGGNPARATVADVHPTHHPPQTSRSARQVGASSRRRPRTRIAPHTPAQPMLYTVYVPRSSLIDHRTIRGQIRTTHRTRLAAYSILAPPARERPDRRSSSASSSVKRSCRAYAVVIGGRTDAPATNTESDPQHVVHVQSQGDTMRPRALRFCCRRCDAAGYSGRKQRIRQGGVHPLLVQVEGVLRCVVQQLVGFRVGAAVPEHLRWVAYCNPTNASYNVCDGADRTDRRGRNAYSHPLRALPRSI